MKDYLYPIGFTYKIGSIEWKVKNYIRMNGKAYYNIGSRGMPDCIVSEEDITKALAISKRQEQPEKKEKTFTEDDMVSFALHFVEGTEDDIRNEIQIWKEKKAEKRAKEYEEYLRLKKIFGE